MNKKVSIVIPVFNEEDTIEKVIKAVDASPVLGMEKEIIIVDDFSTDDTKSKLKDEIRQLVEERLKIIFNEKNFGKGYSVRRGLKEATGDFIIIQDADLEYDPKEYEKLLGPLVSGTVDVVYGSRFKNNPFVFKTYYAANRFLTWLSNIWTGLDLTDMETCYKCFSRKALNSILPHLKSCRFEIEPEITTWVARKNLKITEVPISYYRRSYAEGKKIGWRDGLQAMWTIVSSKVSGLIILSAGVLLLFSSSFFLNPQVQGDTVSYLEAMSFLSEGVFPEGMVFNRIITTFGGLWAVILFSKVSGSVLGSWFVMNTLFYTATVFVFYKLLKLFFREEVPALFGALFLGGSYAILRFGLNFLMDMGGWAFYTFSIFFSLRYVKFSNRKDILLASLMVGVGGLFKEYAFLGVVPIAFILIYENWPSIFSTFKKSILPAFLAVLPIALVYVYTYFNFGYTYLDWFGANRTHYYYESRVIEWVKVLGSLLNFLGILFVTGLVVLYKEWSNLNSQTKVFLLSIFFSFLPVFAWPAITQRLFFVVVPFTVLVSCFFINRYRKYWYFFVPILVIYVAVSLFMDSFILKSINLPWG